MLRRAISTSTPESGPGPESKPEAAARPLLSPGEQRARVRAMFDAHHRLVWRSLRRYGLDPEAAADMTQQAFVVALERAADIWPGSERAFLIGTALRLARSARRMTARYCLDTQLEERLIQMAPHPEKSATTLELLDRVLAQLDNGLVEVFVLFDIEGMSGPELARALGIPIGTVASRVRRAREAFRAAAQRVELTRAREEAR